MNDEGVFIGRDNAVAALCQDSSRCRKVVRV